MEKHITSEHADLKWERLRLQYLRKCRRTLYTELLATDKLNEHLGEINEQADSMFSQLVKQLAEQQGITEALKAENQLLWVQQMNNVQNVAAEIVLNELKIYAECRRSREEMRELLAAKANVDRLLKLDEEQKKEQEKDHDQR